MRAIVDEQYGHLVRVRKILQELWCNKEVLRCIFFTSSIYNHFKHPPLIDRVHSLIDFIDDSERTSIKLLQSHQVQHGGDASLAAALMVRRQLVQLGAAAELDADSNSVFIVVFLVFCMEINFTSTLHGTEKIAEFFINFFHELL